MHSNRPGSAATAPLRENQISAYLRLADKRLGLLINFGMETLLEGFSRVANGLGEAHAEAQRPQSKQGQKGGLVDRQTAE